MTFAIQQGLIVLPNVIVVLLLVVPVCLFVYLGITHESAKIFCVIIHKRPLMALTLFILAGAMFGVILWFLTGYVVSLNANKKQTTLFQKSYSQMNNDELRVATEKYVARLRKFNNEYVTIERRVSDQEYETFRLKPEGKEREGFWLRGIKVERDRHGRYEAAFKDNFLTDARLLDQELRKRAEPSVLAPSDDNRNQTQLMKGMLQNSPSLAGPTGWVLDELASYLEGLSKRIPSREDE